MTIAEDSLIDFFGTQVSVDDGSTSAITNNSFSVAADISTFTNADDAPSCVMVLRCQWATVPTNKSVINIYARKMNIQSTNDSPLPSAQNLDQFIGQFIVDGDVATATNAFHPTNWLTLPNHITSQQYEFYLENLTGQTISSGWAMFLTPLTKGPHPA